MRYLLILSAASVIFLIAPGFTQASQGFKRVSGGEYQFACQDTLTTGGGNSTLVSGQLTDTNITQALQACGGEGGSNLGRPGCAPGSTPYQVFTQCKDKCGQSVDGTSGTEADRCKGGEGGKPPELPKPPQGGGGGEPGQDPCATDPQGTQCKCKDALVGKGENPVESKDVPAQCRCLFDEHKNDASCVNDQISLNDTGSTDGIILPDENTTNAFDSLSSLFGQEDSGNNDESENQSGDTSSENEGQTSVTALGSLDASASGSLLARFGSNIRSLFSGQAQQSQQQNINGNVAVSETQSSGTTFGAPASGDGAGVQETRTSAAMGVGEDLAHGVYNTVNNIASGVTAFADVAGITRILDNIVRFLGL